MTTKTNAQKMIRFQMERKHETVICTFPEKTPTGDDPHVLEAVCPHCGETTRKYCDNDLRVITGSGSNCFHYQGTYYGGGAAGMHFSWTDEAKPAAGRGGKRAGAGRPTAQSKGKRVDFYIAPELVAVWEGMTRGEKSKFVNDAIREKIEREN